MLEKCLKAAPQMAMRCFGCSNLHTSEPQSFLDFLLQRVLEIVRVLAKPRAICNRRIPGARYAECDLWSEVGFRLLVAKPSRRSDLLISAGSRQSRRLGWKIGVRRVGKKSGPDPIFLGCRKFGSGPDFFPTRLTPIFASFPVPSPTLTRPC